MKSNHRSITNRKWQVKNQDTSAPLLDRILANRDIQKINMDETDLHSPFNLHGMDIAVERILKAIKGGERIMVYGDYDVDGTTASAILYMCLKKAGAKISVRLPNRQTDGYGLNNKFVDECDSLNVKIIITVDTGSTAHTEANYAKEKGIHLIVTDHHIPPDTLPNAFSIINPRLSECNYHNKELCGTAVAWKLCHALSIELKNLTPPPDKGETDCEPANNQRGSGGHIVRREDSSKIDHQSASGGLQNKETLTIPYVLQFLDLVALSTICDCMPLIGENRAIVSLGLKQIQNCVHPGMKALIQACDLDPKKIDTYHLGFIIGPCINAAGRLADPMLAFNMLIGKTEYAHQLRQLNIERQEVLRQAMFQAEKMVPEKPKNLIFLYREDWHLGIVGLIAGRICEKYGLPTIACGMKSVEMEGEDPYPRSAEYVGSCRSVPQINIKEMLDAASDVMTKYGGHAQAAGFSVEKNKITKLKETLERKAKQMAKNVDLTKMVKADTQITTDEITWENLADIVSLAPFGLGNPRPKFLIKNAKVTEVRKIGKEQNHLKIKLGTQDAIAFNFGEHNPIISRSRQIDIVCSIEENEWKNKKTLQLKIEDVSINQGIN
jgi:single-stranded-DNA-specific exonuclease